MFRRSGNVYDQMGNAFRQEEGAATIFSIVSIRVCENVLGMSRVGHVDPLRFTDSLTKSCFFSID